jgi:hypothetical protein
MRSLARVIGWAARAALVAGVGVVFWLWWFAGGEVRGAECSRLSSVPGEERLDFDPVIVWSGGAVSIGEQHYRFRGPLVLFGRQWAHTHDAGWRRLDGDGGGGAGPWMSPPLTSGWWWPIETGTDRRDEPDRSYAERRVSVRYWFLAVVLGAWPLATLTGPIRRRVRGWRRRRRGCCARCGYDLRGTRERCPECGAAAAQDARERV